MKEKISFLKEKGFQNREEEEEKGEEKEENEGEGGRTEEEDGGTGGRVRFGGFVEEGDHSTSTEGNNSSGKATPRNNEKEEKEDKLDKQEQKKEKEKI